jgi:DNA-binding response OmpR family regulator
LGEVFGSSQVALLLPREDRLEVAASVGPPLSESQLRQALPAPVGRVCTRKMILENVWGPAYTNELHYLKVYAYRLRRKLHDEKGLFPQSDPSVGHRLVPFDGSSETDQRF